MGSSPKPPKIIPPPPPVTTNAADVGFVRDEARRKQFGRQGYQSTLLQPAGPAPKKTLLGG